ncbi:ferritin-like domain-containing protein [Bacteriovorax sp. PP10]|uniref:Ferritin-like domain-containing protein n=1 Tax=Bacteriovorax antarcticus TaxID=3088717 RepID=A0ABU5VVB2_9BACT|nr:ferritin-like domain-containing protein [Bacteriovorax sp. PP10]MEA9356988.1 ferritin-like domain-containing protein [Bacteriovorax sp. PP10]
MKINKDQLFLKNISENESKIERLVKVSFAANGFTPVEKTITDGLYWGENFFFLNKSSLWKSLKEEQKFRILSRMNEHLLREAYYIENAGMLYAAKMNIIAESQEERSFFSIMGFEEAEHLQSLTPFLNANITASDVPSFSSHIGKIITEGDRPSNLFLIQILLEGWGLSYYQTLAEQSADKGMREVFLRIIKDETRHHSAGVLLLEKKQTEQNTFLLDAFHELLNMVRIGPWTLIQEIKKEVGDLSEKHTKILISEINAVSDTNQKLARLKLLTEKSLGDELLNKFQKNGIWLSYSEEDMLKAHS